jgi:dihydrofolate reductase
VPLGVTALGFQFGFFGIEMALPVSIVVAVAKNGIIGRDGEMPWRLSSDLKRFKTITMGNPIIMGRKTFESIGRVLPGRHNIVITRNSCFDSEGVTAVASLDEALKTAELWAEKNDAKEICILGGGEIYQQSLNLAHRLYYTEVKAEPAGDTRFPDLEEDDWKVSHKETVPAGVRDNFETRFIIYERKKSG